MSDPKHTTSEYAELGRALKVFKVMQKTDVQCGHTDWSPMLDEVPGDVWAEEILGDYFKSQLDMAMQDRDSDSDQCNRCSRIYFKLHKDDPRINAKWVGDPCDCNEDIDADVLVYDKI